MGLIKCKECGEKVSSKAKSCPKCGAPVKKKKKGCLTAIFIFIGFIIFLNVITRLPNTNKPTNKYQVNSTHPATKKTHQESALSISNIEIVDFRFETREYDNTLDIIGELKNNNKIGVGVELQAIVCDDNGSIVNSTTFWPASIKNIPAGTSWPIKFHIDGKGRGKNGALKVIDVKVWD